MYFTLVHRTSYSNTYDAVEMHSNSATEPEPTLYDTPFKDNSNEVILEENPAYQITK